MVRLGRLSLWKSIPLDQVRRRYAAQVEPAADREIAETFFNSAIRRLNGTVGVDETTEFLDLSPPRWTEDPDLHRERFESSDQLVLVLQRAIESLGLSAWRDPSADADRLAARLHRDRPEVDRGGELTWHPAPFVRNRRAFLIARLTTSLTATPVVAAIVGRDDGLAAEAVVTTPDEASIVFGFTRSYFQADVGAPRGTVAFLHSLLPTKRIDELYTVIGYHHHGKREFYQTLHRILGDPDARFEPVEGTPGMVMIAFVLKPMNAVFKIIKDRCDPPKHITRREVMGKYRFVFVKEHGGRLADSQEFVGLSLPIRAFHPAVRADLEANAQESIQRIGDRWVFNLLYTERRMTPLDVFLRTASPAAAEAAVMDYGRAIKELAAINVFPGDMLAKNFGVTRHGRVVFYDYDEICPLTDCTFRTIPEAKRYDDEMAAEPWFSVRDSDVFPEEFERFLRFPEPLHQLFRQRHGDLFSAEYWNEIRRRVEAGETTEPAPYGPEHLLP